MFMNKISKRKRHILHLGFFLLFFTLKTHSKCTSGCTLAFASYYIQQPSNLTYISTIFAQSIPEILLHNPQMSNPNSIPPGTRINVPFSCLCLNSDFLGHTFKYKTQIGDTYDKIARLVFANLTSEDWVQRVNSFEATLIPDFADVNVTVNCTCGDRHVSRDYGVFATYPLREGEDLEAVAAEYGVDAAVVERFNRGVDFGGGSGLVFVPAKG